MANISNTSEITSSDPAIVLSAQIEVVAPACGPRSLLQDVFLPQVMDISKALFGDAVTVESMIDPSEPAEAWLCFNVSAVGSDADLLKRELEWHEKVECLTGDRSGKYRLSIYPIE